MTGSATSVGTLGFAGLWQAALHLDNYLSKNGNKITINYYRMLKDSDDAKGDYLLSLSQAMKYAEILAQQDTIVNIVQKGHNRGYVTDDMNWQYAIQTYHTWDKGQVKKGKGNQSCCYKMEWALNLRDNYEFQNQHVIGGIVYDDEMWELNHYGWAKHFKIRGKHNNSIIWIKGYRPKIGDLNNCIKGKFPVFPQCSGM